eukprot:GHVU01176387.1.p1 GENE.GHVU01176387.1~~GHVU01176387.1.p1  ORF type:complete len:159 (-),score=14.35 GHVU01176387.1:14-490(-)
MRTCARVCLHVCVFGDCASDVPFVHVRMHACMHASVTPGSPVHAAMPAATKLRALMREQCVPLPGAYNGLVGRLVKDAGFEGFYVCGAAVAAAQGLPDVGLVGLESFCRVIKEVYAVTGLPCIADADTGMCTGMYDPVVFTFFCVCVFLFVSLRHVRS